MKISVITATCNSAAHIAGCMTSANNQTCNNIDHIIVDGVSTDNTMKLKPLQTVLQKLVQNRTMAFMTL